MARSLYALLNSRFGNPPDKITRREMLKQTLAATAGLLLSNTVGLGQARVGKRVVVVGGGFSGLAAAYELHSAGYDVTVVEARNRLGGRVFSSGAFVAGKNVEIGGEFIGSNHPTWVAYADKFGLKFLDVTEEDFEAPILLGGKRLSAEESEALWEEMEKALGQMNGEAQRVNADEPWRSANAVVLDRRTTASWVDALKVSPTCKLGIHAQLTGDNGVSTARQSYLGNLAMVKGGGLEKYWTESEVYRCQGGNQQLATKLAAAIGSNRVLRATPVVSVTVKQNVASVGLANGKTLEADYVILTVPPPTWKRITFAPPLPPHLMLQMGSSVKFLVALKSRFWRDAELAPDCLTDGPVTMTWEATDNQPGDANAALTAFSSGPAAETCRQWNASSRANSYLTELEKLYADIRKQHVRDLFMDWPSDLWAQGGYSFPSPGEVTAIGPLLRQGVGPIQFAGEYASYAFIGYMEGALNSGASLAKRIAQRDGVAKSLEEPRSATPQATFA